MDNNSLALCCLWVFAVFPLVSGVPAKTPEMEELQGLKSSIKLLSGQMEKLNFLYLNNLEPKVAMAATALTSMDANLKNVQERAHVWDTFQLYIASWNEQMSTTDRKLDIISKGQEKLFTLDAKVNSIVGLGLEYKIDNVHKRLQQVEENLTTLNKNVLSSPKDTLFAEFAARGILTTVKSIEKQLGDNNCNSTRDFISDISAKVDIIYDRVNAKEEDVDEEDEEEFEGSGEGLMRVKRKRGCGLKSALNNTEANILRVLETQEFLKEKLNQQSVVDLGSYFSEQRAHLESILQKNCPVSAPAIPITTTPKPKRKSAKHSCTDLYARETGIYYSEETPIYCIKNDHTWTLIQRRTENPPYENFSLPWEHYRAGFGNVEDEFWAGNDYIHAITSSANTLLRIELEDFKGNFAWAEYETFRIGSEEENYVLSIGGFSGNASDALSSHNNTMFSTFDRKNDKAPECCPCAVSFGGGWWYNSCFEANLNGIYLDQPQLNGYYGGIIWEPWLGNYSLKRTKMMIRTKTEDDKDTKKRGENAEIPFYEDP